MSSKTKKKLCWNCEGRVGFTEEHCPFCGVYLSPSPSAEESQHETESYSPPYSIDSSDTDTNVPPSPYQSVRNEDIPTESLEGGQMSLTSVLPSDQMRQIIIPLGLLLAGSVFFLFGLVLLLFSRDGKFTLQWNGDNWYFYFTVSLAMLFFGWRALQDVDDESD